MTTQNDITTKRMEYINNVGTQFMRAVKERMDYYSALAGGRIATAISVEGIVHATAMAAVGADLIIEMKRWAAMRRESSDELSNRIDAIAWDLAVRSIENCEALARVDETDQFVELVGFIMKSLGKAVGLDVIESVLELIDAFRKVDELQTKNQRTAFKIMLEIETFGTTALLAIQYAVAQVGTLPALGGAITPQFEKSLEQLGAEVMARSRKNVENAVMKARADFMADLSQKTRALASSLRFPPAGFWVDTVATD